MSENYAKHLTDEQLAAEIVEMTRDIKAGKISEDEAERNEYFTDPANAEEIDIMQARLTLVEAMYKARHEAGLTQKQLAEKIGVNQTYIAAVERGKKNITFATLAKYAAACGKKVALL